MNMSVMRKQQSMMRERGDPGRHCTTDGSMVCLINLLIIILILNISIKK